MANHRHKLITLGILTAAATGIIHIINNTVSAAATMKEMLLISDKNYYNWRFGKIYYTKQGKGTPILLIHDLLPGSSAYEWSKVDRELAINHTVYTIDLLGCGRSDKPNITYTNFIYVQMITDFIKNVIKEKTDVISSGFSSSFTLMALHSEPELFKKTMVINPPSLVSLNQIPTRHSKFLKFTLELPVFGTLIYNMLTSKENVDNIFTEQLFYNPFHIDRGIVDAYYEGAHRGRGNAKHLYASLIGRYTNLNILHGIKAIDHSVFIVEGEKEPGSHDIIEDYTYYNPSFEHAFIKLSKHFPHVETADRFLDQVNIFF